MEAKLETFVSKASIYLNPPPNRPSTQLGFGGVHMDLFTLCAEGLFVK